MRRYSTFIILAGIFIFLSALAYYVHYLIFRDVHHIFIYMVGDLAFLPLEVFLVVIVIERILARREKQAIRKKLNMVEESRRPGDPATLVAGSQKIKNDLGWKPEYDSLDTIIETAWRWHTAYPTGYNR